MDQDHFQSVLKYYLSCMDAEEATHLRLRKDQEYKSYIHAARGERERLFSENLPQLDIPVTDARQRQFIERKAPDSETLIDLHYGFPVFVDDRDMLSPLFVIEVEANFSGAQTLRLLPKLHTLSVTRLHFINRHDPEEAQRICEELEGEFGSFDARMKAAEAYIPSLAQKTGNWIAAPVLFRTSLNSSRSGLRYDLRHLLKTPGVLAEDTALKFFVQGTPAVVKQEQSEKSPPPVLEISALNEQQEDAVLKGLKEPLSVITGPPGTGKTQVVTALLASAVFNNQTVLFASNNNMPVDGVYERLGQSTGDAGNWLMRLGNQNKREACREIISAVIERLKTVKFSRSALDQDIERFTDLQGQIAHTRSRLGKARLLEEQIGQLCRKEYAITQKLPDDWVEQYADSDPAPFNQELIQKLKKHGTPGIGLWLRRTLFGDAAFRKKHNARLTTLMASHAKLAERKNLLLADENWNDAVAKVRETAEHIRLNHNWAVCIARRRRLEGQIADYPSTFDLFELKKKKSSLSRTVFDRSWLGNIRMNAHEALESFNGYFKDMTDYSDGRHKRLQKSVSALKRFFPIWITTNQSASSIMPPQARLFDLVVIDEAGQCDIPSVIPLLYRAKRAVIIGDPHQFRHITSLRDDVEHTLSQSIARNTELADILDDWSYTRRSAFDRALSATQQTVFLKQHYRCHPDIIEFSNHNFYEGKLVAQAPLSHFQNRLPIEESGLIWQHTTGQAIKIQKGAWNPAEVSKTAELFDRWAQQGLFAAPDLTYGVVTPFRKQAEEMRKALSCLPWFKRVEERFTIGTAHSFQGSECDVLIYSPVVAADMPKHLLKFAAAQHDLINVTVTRAKNLLCIVGDLQACQLATPDTPLYKLAAYAEQLRKQQRYPLNTAEKAMANILDELKLTYVPQYTLGQYRLDFMVNAPSGERYDLEVDGDTHLSAKAVQHDERRDAYTMNQGFRVLRFTARDILYKPQVVKERLLRI